MNELIAHNLANDPRVKDARRLVLDALADHQRRLTGVRAPDPGRRDAYEQAIKSFSDLRGGALYYPYLATGAGRGPFVELADGSVKYDLISGIGVHYLGHAHPKLVTAAFDAAMQDTVMQGNLQQNTASADLSRKLVGIAIRNGAKLSHCFLSTSGAMANENALKLAFQKKHPADRVLAFEGAFAGRTLALSQITDKASYRAGLPPTLRVDYVPFFKPDDPDGSTARAVATLKAHLSRYPKQHAVMCMELVQGEGGFNPGERSFFLPLLELLKQNNVAVWFDEVQTFGRTTEPFAFQTFGLDGYADLATVGKLTQVCATLFTDEFRPQPGLISQTFTASTSAVFCGMAVLDELTNNDYFGPGGRVARVREQFERRLREIAVRHPGAVRGPFGIGAMIAFTAFDGDADRTKKILMALFDAGVIAFVAGERPARIRFLPPVGAIEPADIDTVCEILENVLARFEQDVT